MKLELTPSERLLKKLQASRFDCRNPYKPEQFVTTAQDGITISTRNPEAGKLHGTEYYIERGRINTPEKVIAWIHHLSGKNWFSQEHCRQLIQATSRIVPC